MDEPTPSTVTSVQLQRFLARLEAGDPSARRELLNVAAERLTRLTRKMLRASPRVRAFEETGDVFQNAMLRLYRALEQTFPATVLDFYRLAALQIRRELIDLARHYFGPHGLGTNVQPVLRTRVGEDTPQDAIDPSDSSHDPGKLTLWIEFHEHVAALPDDERAVFDLLYYQGLSHAEAADLLGVSTKTIQTRWRNCRLRLYEKMGPEGLPQ